MQSVVRVPKVRIVQTGEAGGIDPTLAIDTNHGGESRATNGGGTAENQRVPVLNTPTSTPGHEDTSGDARDLARSRLPRGTRVGTAVALQTIADRRQLRREIGSTGLLVPPGLSSNLRRGWPRRLGHSKPPWNACLLSTPNTRFALTLRSRFFSDGCPEHCCRQGQDRGTSLTDWNLRGPFRAARK